MSEEAPAARIISGVRYIRADLVERVKEPSGVPSKTACEELTCDCRDACKRAAAGLPA